MEFKYRASQDRRAPSTPSLHSPSNGTYFSDRSLRGCEFSSGGFPGNVPMPRVPVFRTPVPVNAGEVIRRELEREQIRRELEKEEIRREILAREMSRRRELEEEVRREIAMERALAIPLGISFRERVSLSLNQNQIINPSINDNKFGGLQQPRSPPQIATRQQSNKDKLVILAKRDIDHCGAKRIAMKPPTIDIRKHFGFSLQKKAKQEWSCALCEITTTDEKGLNDHLQGKKHKAKEASLRTQKIGKRTKASLSLKSKQSVKSIEAIIIVNSGLDARLDSQKLQPSITPTNTSIVELKKEDQVVQKSQDLGGPDNESELVTMKGGDINALTTTNTSILEHKKEDYVVQKSQVLGGLDNENEFFTRKETGETNTLTTRKKFKFYCALCQVQSRSEIVMESHKNGKKHLTNVKKLSQINDVAKFG